MTTQSGRWTIGIFLSAIFVVFGGALQAQTLIFPDVYGEALLDSLEARYKPRVVLSYNGARDRMYARIDNRGDSLSGVYSGYTIYVPYDHPAPRTLTNAANPPINCEHSWPQSLGAGTGNARSDMHHLFPSNGNVNSARSNLPFGESNDQLHTISWYRDTEVRTSIPPTRIDEYSERSNRGVFEVREDHKGNTARAMFYFYTMYGDQADAIDPTFFLTMRNALRRWNTMDPPDSLEIVRTQAIAQYQDGKPNPFVIDTSLIGRAFFDVTTAIDPLDVPVVAEGLELAQNYPNPFNPETRIRFFVPETGEAHLAVFDLRGREVTTLAAGLVERGWHEHAWRGEDARGQRVASGVYLYRLRVGEAVKVRKMVMLR